MRLLFLYLVLVSNIKILNNEVLLRLVTSDYQPWLIDAIRDIKLPIHKRTEPPLHGQRKYIIALNSTLLVYGIPHNIKQKKIGGRYDGSIEIKLHDVTNDMLNLGCIILILRENIFHSTILPIYKAHFTYHNKIKVNTVFYLMYSSSPALISYVNPNIEILERSKNRSKYRFKQQVFAEVKFNYQHSGPFYNHSLL